MGHHTVILIFAILSFMGWYASVSTTKKLIKQSGLKLKYWPKKYVMPSKMMRKMFALKKREIPRWCYNQLIMSFGYILLFLFSAIVYLIVDEKLFAAQLFVWTYCVIMGLDSLYVFACVIIYK